MRKVIKETSINPKYFEKMSTILDELILERKREAFDYAKYLKKIIELTKKVTRPDKTAGASVNAKEKVCNEGY